jgi:CheY-like chemotaxis protein
MSALHKVLVVDDDPVVGKSFNRVLSQKGYVVITAENAQEALNKLQEAKYDVVFTDIRMPGMDGLELAERVKATHPWTPVVIVTGYGTTANEERAKAAGVSAFLHKPLSPEMIEGSAMNALLEPAPLIIPQQEPRPVEEAHPALVEKENNLTTIALFVAAPFIGLAYVLLIPFVGIGILAGMAIKALAKMSFLKKTLNFLKNVALFIAAPFVGLAYVVMFPFVGAATLAWIGVKALMKKRPAQ